MRTLGTEFPSRARMASTFVKPTPWHTIVRDSIELRLRQCEIELETWLLSWNTIIYFLAHGNFPLHCLILQYCQKGPQKNWPNCPCWKLNQRCIKRIAMFTFREEIVSHGLSANFGDIIKFACLQRKCQAINVMGVEKEVPYAKANLVKIVHPVIWLTKHATSITEGSLMV